MGYVRTAEHRRLMASIRRRDWKNSLVRSRRLHGIKRAWTGKAGDQRRKGVAASISEAMRSSKKFQEVVHSQEYRDKLSESHKLRLKDSKQVEKLVRNLKLDNGDRITKPHLAMFEKLLRAGVKGLKLNSVREGRYLLDIAHLPSKTDIECDGPYWHRSFKHKEHDQKRDTILKFFGWTVIRIRLGRVRDVDNYDVSKLVSQLLQRRTA